MTKRILCALLCLILCALSVCAFAESSSRTTLDNLRNRLNNRVESLTPAQPQPTPPQTVSVPLEQNMLFAQLGDAVLDQAYGINLSAPSNSGETTTAVVQLSFTPASDAVISFVEDGETYLVYQLTEDALYFKTHRGDLVGISYAELFRALTGLDAAQVAAELAPVLAPLAGLDPQSAMEDAMRSAQSAAQRLSLQLMPYLPSLMELGTDVLDALSHVGLTPIFLETGSTTAVSFSADNARLLAAAHGVYSAVKTHAQSIDALASELLPFWTNGMTAELADDVYAALSASLEDLPLHIEGQAFVDYDGTVFSASLSIPETAAVRLSFTTYDDGMTGELSISNLSSYAPETHAFPFTLRVSYDGMLLQVTPARPYPFFTGLSLLFAEDYDGFALTCHSDAFSFNAQFSNESGFASLSTTAGDLLAFDYSMNSYFVTTDDRLAFDHSTSSSIVVGSQTPSFGVLYNGPYPFSVGLDGHDATPTSIRYENGQLILPGIAPYVVENVARTESLDLASAQMIAADALSEYEDHLLTPADLFQALLFALSQRIY